MLVPGLVFFFFKFGLIAFCKGISNGPTQTTNPRMNASARTEHTAQRDDPNRQSCLEASARTHSGLRFGPEMRRPGKPACSSLSAPGPTDRGSKPFPLPSPPLCFSVTCAPPPFCRRRRHAHRRCLLAAPDRQQEASPSTAP
jgi:hypothetical protein